MTYIPREGGKTGKNGEKRGNGVLQSTLQPAGAILVSSDQTYVMKILPDVDFGGARFWYGVFLVMRVPEYRHRKINKRLVNKNEISSLKHQLCYLSVSQDFLFVQFPFGVLRGTQWVSLHTQWLPISCPSISCQTSFSSCYHIIYFPMT